MGGLIAIIIGMWFLWWVKNKSNQSEIDKKYERIIGWILIGGGLGYIIASSVHPY